MSKAMHPTIPEVRPAIPSQALEKSIKPNPPAMPKTEEQEIASEIADGQIPPDALNSGNDL